MVELQFMARAAAHGLTVSKPWGDSARYDFIVESGGHFLRVQVKSTTCRDRNAYLCNTVSRGPAKGSRPQSYTVQQVEFFALYVIPEDVWYIVPLAELKRARYAVYLNPYDRHSRYFRYLEAWHLLTTKAAAKSE